MNPEVMLAAVSAWGLEQAIPRLWGMFAFALWDRAERRLHLVRDRLGKKPLYYGWFGDMFLFGSELKALRAHPAFRASLDREDSAQRWAQQGQFFLVWSCPQPVASAVLADLAAL